MSSCLAAGLEAATIAATVGAVVGTESAPATVCDGETAEEEEEVAEEEVATELLVLPSALELVIT